MRLCACGCGEEIIIKPHHKYYDVPTYIRGHNARCMTQETKDKISLHTLGKQKKSQPKKLCADCGKILSSNYANYCKPCYQQYHKYKQILTEEEKLQKLQIRAQYHADWVKNKRKKLKALGIKSMTPDWWKRYLIKHTYGITLEQFDELLKQQNYSCAICGIKHDISARHKKLHIDHDHKSNKIRGLICLQCNTGLGKFKDDTELMRKAIRYLENNNGTKISVDTIN